MNRESANSPGGDDHEVSLHDVWNLLVAGRRTVLAVAAGVVGAALMLCLVLDPVYESTGSLQVDSANKDSGASLAGLAGGDIAASVIGATDPTSTQIEILKSRKVLDPVIEKMNLDVVIRPARFPLFGAALARRNERAATQPVAAPWGFGRWAWGGEQLVIDTMQVPRDVLGDCLTLRVEDDGDYVLLGAWGGELLRGRVGTDASSGDGRFVMHVSTLRARPGTRFTVVRNSRIDTVGNLIDALDVQETASSSGVIGVRFTAATPGLAAQFVDNLLASYLEQNRQRRAGVTTQTREYLEKRLPQLSERLDEATRKLAEYEQTLGSPDVGKEIELLLSNSVALKMKRLDLQTELDRARQKYGPQSPTIHQLQNAIAAVEREQADNRARMDALPTGNREWQTLQREAKNLVSLHDVVQGAINKYLVLEAGSVANVRVVDAADVPDEPVSPRTTLILLASVPLGLFLGVAWVLIQRALIRGMDNPSEVEFATGLQTSMVPFSRAQQAALRRHKRLADMPRVLAELDPRDPAIDALRLFNASHTLEGVVMLCGPAAGVGKTFLLANLGAVIAQGGQSVVLVDADLRGGSLHRYFDDELSPGICEYVSGLIDVDSIVRRSEIDGLDYVTSGEKQPGSTSVLRHPRFPELMGELAKRYRTVLVAAPAVLARPDASSIGRLANMTVLTLGATQHKPHEILDAVNRLAAAGVNVGSALLNRVGERAGSYGYRGYGVSRYE